MPFTASTFSIDPRKVVHETLDGETILIHLETGNYYSLTGAGAEIWSLLAAGRQPADIARELAERHDRDRAEVEVAVEGILEQLEAEDVLQRGANGTSAAAAPPSWQADSWAAPKLERYDDMQDFLLVDPIHEVDDAGWPSRKPD